MITVDATSYVPPFEQVRAQFAAAITNNELPAGTRLPTVRQLAADLGLAVNTVARAYRELETAGLVETRGRAGTTVTSGGNHARERLASAAQRYAELARSVGATDRDAVAHVDAALRAAQPGAAAAQVTRVSGGRRDG